MSRLEQPGDLGHLAVPPDERIVWFRQVVPPGRGWTWLDLDNVRCTCVAGKPAEQNRLVELLGDRLRFDIQLAVESVTQKTILPQRQLTLTGDGIQSHETGMCLLARRVRGDNPLERIDCSRNISCSFVQVRQPGQRLQVLFTK